MREFLKLYDIENHTSAARNSTGNSPVERLHSTLIEALRIIKYTKPKLPFDESLDLAVLTYNNSIHSSTKLTPFEVINGIRDKTILNPSNNALNEYNATHLEETNIIKNIISKQTDKLHDKLEKQNENLTDPPILTNDPVYVKNTQMKQKLRPTYDKKPVVEDNKLTFISQTKNNKKLKYHKAKLKQRKK